IAKDTMQVTVNPVPNQIPSANAGADQVITLPTNSSTLNGSGTDPDGTIASFKWLQITVPSTSTIANASTAQTTVSALVQGSYKYDPYITHYSRSIAKDTMQVTVNPAPNQLPTADAGADLVITLPTNSATLNGSG